MIDYKNLSEHDAIALRVAIGQKVAQLLNLQVDAKTGWIKTTTGKKSIQGLGSTIIGIMEDEFKRLTDEA